jgi:hypothetical protein
MSHYTYTLQLLVEGVLYLPKPREITLLDAIDPEHPLNHRGLADYHYGRWNYEAPLARLSREVKGTTLCLTVFDHDANEGDNYWRDFFKNGSMQTVFPSLTFAYPNDYAWLVVKENSGGEEEDEAIEV